MVTSAGYCVTRSLWLLMLFVVVSCSAGTRRAEEPAAARTPVPQEPALSSVDNAADTTTEPSEQRGGPTAMPSTPTATNTVLPSHTATPPAPTTPPATITVTAPTAELLYSYPIGLEGRAPGDGFFIRHGYGVENTWYNPGYWHTGEDWYALEGDTAGASVLAVGDGVVVYAGGNYPGRVVILEHAEGLYSMYGHLDPALSTNVGERVARGARLGSVVRRGDETPNHLHFEMRTFLTTDEVNGRAPRYAFRCGPQCPPGPGYWPIDALELPGTLGWRNPTHVIARRGFEGVLTGAIGEVIVASQPVSSTVTLWSEIGAGGQPGQHMGEIELIPGERYALSGLRAGPEETQATSARSYVLWYELQLPDGRLGWVQAVVPSAFETGSDGREATVRFNFYPADTSPPGSR